jgi:hypothetical protein
VGGVRLEYAGDRILHEKIRRTVISGVARLSSNAKRWSQDVMWRSRAAVASLWPALARASRDEAFREVGFRPSITPARQLVLRSRFRAEFSHNWNS